MSILPSQTQGHTSSSSSSSNPSFNPDSQHGEFTSLSPQPQSLQSLQIQDSQSTVPDSPHNSGSLAQDAHDSGGSSKKVNAAGTQNGVKTSFHENTNSRSRRHSGGPGVRSVHFRGKTPDMSSQGQQSAGTLGSPGSTPTSTGRRAQMMNGNHLLNFHYGPISRPQPRAPPPRRQQKIKPYNKDLFLQANYKFIVLDSGNYSPESMDPDKMLQWEDIICVRYSTPSLVQCPICLEYPLCPQMSSCGHIFCFPCILRYLLMGVEDHKGECWKRCPLCFVMISPKDLYTVYIENVKQYSVGDTIDVMLLTRQKESFSVSYKNRQESDGALFGHNDIYDPISKFTLTSDVDLSVREAISDLDDWLVKADSGLVDDLERLPYVSAAMEQLEQRKKYWNEHKTYGSSKSTSYTDSQTESHLLHSSPNANAITYKPDGTCLDETSYVVESLDSEENVSSSYDEGKSAQRHLNGCRDVMDKDSYNFYQAADGQHLILHPLCMKCLLHHYGGYDMLPHRISGKILQLETVTQSEAMRKRYRYLSHFSLTTTFQLCEIDFSELLPSAALVPFIDEIKKREKQRKQLAKKELKEKIKTEASTEYPISILPNFRQYSHDNSPMFSMDDFEALGSSMTTSSPPAGGERKLLFSSVTRLGFAAAHHLPALKIEETNSSNNNQVVSSDPSSVWIGSGSAPSFANVISRAKLVENMDVAAAEAPEAKTNEVGRKGKKPSRVLLSTAGGRRY